MLLIRFMLVMAPVCCLSTVTPKATGGKRHCLRFGRGRLNARNVADDCYLDAGGGAVKLSKQKVIVKHLDAIQTLAQWIFCALIKPAP